MPETSMPLPLARIEHRMAGRLRLRVPSRRGDAAFFATVANRLSRWPGVRALRTNPRTGSILIEHDADPEQLAMTAKEQGLFAVEPPAGTVAGPAGARQRGVPVPRVSLAAAGLAGLGLYQAARGRFLGSATENLWNAYGAYAVLDRPRVAVALTAFGLWQLAAGRVLGSAVSLMFYALVAQRMTDPPRDGA